MPLPPDNLGEGIVFWGCPSEAFVRPLVRTDLVAMIGYLTNGLNSHDQTYDD